MTAVLIMAGGASKRMRASGDPQHKALRRVHGLTLLEHNVRAVRRAGFRTLYIAVNGREERLLAYVREHQSRWGKAQLLIEHAPLGTIGIAHALAELDTDVLVINVDNLSCIDLRALVAHHRQTAAVLTVATHVEPFDVPLGEVAISEGRVTAYREKPQLPVQISSGTNVLSNIACRYLPNDRATDVPGLVQELLAGGLHVAAFEHADAWIDCNDDGALERAHAIAAGGRATEASAIAAIAEARK